MKTVTPKVFVVGSSAQDFYGLRRMFRELGVPDWETDAESDAEKLTEVAGKLCYMSFDTSLNDNLTRTGTRNNHDYIQQGLIETLHGSVLEHTTVNFVLLNVSRVLTHELVRHGEGTAFSQESGRYVRATELGVYIPTIISDNPALLAEFCNTIRMVQAQYDKLVELSGIKGASDFKWKKVMTSALRRVLPEGRANAIFFTANHRALRHIIEMRTSRHAEEEIRVAFYEVFLEVKRRYPAIYADGKTTFVDGCMEVAFDNSKV